ncbi:MAG: FKBP-type peptidyl-prolyl cis-trans isomerase [Paludibacteraceae bacterium]|nr:FKBP-type peptidyl-prolyl cis-trans isomerase [Paludibacteraceae bacterium]
MNIKNGKVVTCTYELYVGGEQEKEELMEKATASHPLTYCQGEGMMLPKFEEQMQGRAQGETFDFRIGKLDAYGEYDEQGLMELDKRLFYNGDGEFDEERVFVGNIIPMNTTDGQIVNAQVCEITNDKVTIDLNHPLAGEDLHFIGTIIEVRDVTPAELDAIRHPHKCGHCKGHCNDCSNDCGGEHNKTCNKENCNGKHSCNRGQA